MVVPTEKKRGGRVGLDREQLEKNHHDENRFREQTYGYQEGGWGFRLGVWD